MLMKSALLILSAVAFWLRLVTEEIRQLFHGAYSLRYKTAPNPVQVYHSYNAAALWLSR